MKSKSVINNCTTLQDFCCCVVVRYPAREIRSYGDVIES